MVASFGVLTVCAGVALVVEPDRAAQVMLPTLVLQAFAVSVGFTAFARRGYYDVLLTSGAGRLRAAVVHWVMAAAPGGASWVMLGIVERAIPGSGREVMSSGTAAAMFVVSTLPWAMTVAVPRFTGAIGWLLLGVMVVTLTPLGDRDGSVWRAPVEDGSWRAAWECLLFPMRLVGVDAGPRLAAVTPAVALASASMVAALTWIERTDLPLEASQ